MDESQVLSLARRVFSQDIEALESLQRELGPGFYQTAAAVARCPGIVWTTGVGTSAAVAERWAHILNCCGRPSMFLHPSDSMHGHAGVMRPGDLLVALSRGGESAEVNALAQMARQRQVTVVAMVHATQSSLAMMSDYILPVRSKQEYELQGVIATTSTVVFSAMCDALAAVVWELTGYSLSDFARTHPGGAVGKMLAEPGREVSP